MKNNDFDKPRRFVFADAAPIWIEVCVILINWTSISFGFDRWEKVLNLYQLFQRPLIGFGSSHQKLAASEANHVSDIVLEGQTVAPQLVFN